MKYRLVVNKTCSKRSALNSVLVLFWRTPVMEGHKEIASIDLFLVEIYLVILEIREVK